jgi:hypothetical protein
VTVTAPEPARDERERPRTLVWVALGGGVVATGVGVAATVYEYSEAAIWNDDGRCLQGTLSRAAQCGSHRTNANVGQAIAITAYALGGAAAVTCAVLLLRGREPAKPGVACALGVAGLSCEGSFRGL